ncbi:MAG TPA: hypothetical protein VF121_07620 [Thermoanaerobaculia bacterium]|nr:hypothetical protein [Thermoanaerobaculia bacterium]
MTRRPPSLLPRLCALAVLLPAGAGAAAPAPPESAPAIAAREEVRFESACEARGRKVRRCRTAAGDVRLACAAAHPLAAFWDWLRRREDDGVRVVVAREEGGSEAGGEAGAESGKRTVRRSARHQEVPACRPGE